MTRSAPTSIRVLFWGAIVFGFSPVLIDIARHVWGQTSDLYVVLPLILIAVLLRVDVAIDLRPPRVQLGTFLTLLGLGLQVLGIAGDSWSIARSGLPIGILGAALITGVPPAKIAVLTVGLVPIPALILVFASPTFETWLAAGAASVLRLFGLPFEAIGPGVAYSGLRFELIPEDMGITTAVILAEYGWFRALIRGSDAQDSAYSALRFGLSVLWVQPLLILLSLLAIPVTGLSFGRSLLTFGFLVAIAAISVTTGFLGRNILERR